MLAAGVYLDGNHVSEFGTSFSSPIVAGVVSLMLQANPGLGYRDVQEILAYSARQTVAEELQWDYNHACPEWTGRAQ